MTCETLRNKDGRVIGIVCSRGHRKKLCATCRKRTATKLCDYPLRGKYKGKTCSAPMCDACAVPMGRQGGDTVDYCRPHAEIGQHPLPLQEK